MANRGEEKVRVHMNVVPRSTGNTNSGTRELTLKCRGGRGFDSHRGQKIFSLPRVVSCFSLLGLTPSGLFMGLSSTIIYTSLLDQFMASDLGEEMDTETEISGDIRNLLPRKGSVNAYGFHLGEMKANRTKMMARYIHTYIHKYIRLLTTSPKGLFSANYKEKDKNKNIYK